MIFEIWVILDFEGDLIALVFLEQKVLFGVHENRQRIGVTVDFSLIVEEKVFIRVLLRWKSRWESRPLDVCGHEEEFDFVFAIGSEEEDHVEFEFVTFVEVEIAFLDIFEVANSLRVFMLSDLLDKDVLCRGEFNDTGDVFVDGNVLVLEEPGVIIGKLVEGFLESEELLDSELELFS